MSELHQETNRVTLRMFEFGERFDDAFFRDGEEQSMTETPLREIENCGVCSFATCADESYATIRCTLFPGDGEKWVLRSACCEECRHAPHRDALRRRMLEFEGKEA